MLRRMVGSMLLVSLLQGCSQTTSPQGGMRASGAAVASVVSAKLLLGRDVLHARDLAPVVAQGPGEFDNALAMNVQVAPIAALRQQLITKLGKPLTFFKGWNPNGEAHVTVITPVEYYQVLSAKNLVSPLLSIQRIGEIARAHGLQSADLEVLGLGCGRKEIEGQTEETYFVIVRSQKLLDVRRAIHREFVARGGDGQAWEPEHFYPHITVAYTRRDLHEADDVLKDVAHSLDPRFKLEMVK